MDCQQKQKQRTQQRPASCRDFSATNNTDRNQKYEKRNVGVGKLVKAQFHPQMEFQFWKEVSIIACLDTTQILQGIHRKGLTITSSLFCLPATAMGLTKTKQRHTCQNGHDRWAQLRVWTQRPGSWAQKFSKMAELGGLGAQLISKQIKRLVSDLYCRYLFRA